MGVIKRTSEFPRIRSQVVTVGVDSLRIELSGPVVS
jgi:hypothetical protein